jgi:hypothetical protein
MIVIRVEMHSAITGKVSEIAKMIIANDGSIEADSRGNYWCKTYRKDSGAVSRQGTVFNYPRKSRHVWSLVARALKAMEYR